jgi:hypothetical protein
MEEVKNWVFVITERIFDVVDGGLFRSSRFPEFSKQINLDCGENLRIREMRREQVMEFVRDPSRRLGRVNKRKETVMGVRFNKLHQPLLM